MTLANTQQRSHHHQPCSGRIFILILAQLWNAARLIHGLPSGAPICANRPPHGRESSRPTPYTISFSESCYQHNAMIEGYQIGTLRSFPPTVTLTGEQGTEAFNGFVVEAPAGTFLDTGIEDYRTNCGRYSITHSDHGDKRRIMAEWRAPNNTFEPMTFTTTIFKSDPGAGRTGRGEFWYHKTVGKLLSCAGADGGGSFRRRGGGVVVSPTSTPRPIRRDLSPTTVKPRNYDNVDWITTLMPQLPTRSTLAFYIGKDSCFGKTDRGDSCAVRVQRNPDRCAQPSTSEHRRCTYSCCIIRRRRRNQVGFPTPQGQQNQQNRPPSTPNPLDFSADIERFAKSGGCSKFTDQNRNCRKWVLDRPGACVDNHSYEHSFCTNSCCRKILKRTTSPPPNNLISNGRENRSEMIKLKSECHQLTDKFKSCHRWTKAASQPCDRPVSYESVRCKRSCCLWRQNQGGLEGHLEGRTQEKTLRSPKKKAAITTEPLSADCGGLTDVQDACKYWVLNGFDRCDVGDAYVRVYCQRSCCEHSQDGPQTIPASHRRSETTDLFRSAADLHKRLPRDDVTGKSSRETTRTSPLNRWTRPPPSFFRTENKNWPPVTRTPTQNFLPSAVVTTTTLRPTTTTTRAYVPSMECGARSDLTTYCDGWVKLHPTNCYIKRAFEFLNCNRSCCAVRERDAVEFSSIGGELPQRPTSEISLFILGDSNNNNQQRQRQRQQQSQSEILAMNCQNEFDQDTYCVDWVAADPNECLRDDSYLHHNCLHSCCRQRFKSLRALQQKRGAADINNGETFDSWTAATGRNVLVPTDAPDPVAAGSSSKHNHRPHYQNNGASAYCFGDEGQDTDGLCEKYVRLYSDSCSNEYSYEYANCKLSCCQYRNGLLIFFQPHQSVVVRKRTTVHRRRRRRRSKRVQ